MILLAGARDVSELGCFPGFALALLPLGLWWYLRLGLVTRLASSHADRLPLYLAPPLGLLLMLPFLLWGDWGPRAGLAPVLFCAGSGMTYVFLASFAFPWLGLSPRDDVAERRNRPAGWAVAGALVGLSVAFGVAAGGAPSGSGVALPLGAAAMAALLGVWAAYEWLTGASEAITVERDRGAAYRLAALLPAAGLMLGLAIWLLAHALLGRGK